MVTCKEWKLFVDQEDPFPIYFHFAQILHCDMANISPFLIFEMFNGNVLVIAFWETMLIGIEKFERAKNVKMLFIPEKCETLL